MIGGGRMIGGEVRDDGARGGVGGYGGWGYGLVGVMGWLLRWGAAPALTLPRGGRGFVGGWGMMVLGDIKMMGGG